MARHYSTKDFFRQMPNALLARYFQGRWLFGELDFSAMKEAKPDELFAAWLALPDGQRNAMDAEFLDIFDMSCEKGFLAVIDEARWQWRETAEALTPFVEMLSTLPNHFERAMVAFMDHKDFWKGATRFYHADTLPYWRKRKNLSHQKAAQDVHINNPPAFGSSKLRRLFRTVAANADVETPCRRLKASTTTATSAGFEGRSAVFVKGMGLYSLSGASLGGAHKASTALNSTA